MVRTRAEKDRGRRSNKNMKMSGHRKIKEGMNMQLRRLKIRGKLKRGPPIRR